MTFRLIHLPTVLLMIGYPLFWLEMWLKPSAHTTPIASLLFVVIAAYLLWQAKPASRLRSFWAEPKSPFLILCGAVGVGILLLAFIQACLPLHLTQEYDAIHYHYSLPRQHLIAGSFAHLPWSAADLWPLPIQCALAPYWFVTELPNKFPQFIFLIGLLAVVWALSNRWNPVARWGSYVALMVVGSHGFAVQFGTGMLDIVQTFLFIAAIHSLLEENYFMSAVEINFWIWSKSFIPIQATLILLTIFIVAWLLRRWPEWRSLIPARFLQWALGIAIVVGGPFLIRGIHYVGTPLPPFGMFALGGIYSRDLPMKEAIQASAQKLTETKDVYGEGRGPWAFVKHFWRIAVPSKGVNNAFDYPLGLPYLLAIGPFLFFLGRGFAVREISLVAISIVLFWATWWVSSQQSRWLYIPLVLMFLSVFSRDEVMSHKLVRTGLFLSLAFTSLSLFRSYAGDLRALPEVHLQQRDINLIDVSRVQPPGTVLILQYKELAFAECPIFVQLDDLTWVLPAQIPKNRAIIPL